MSQISGDIVPYNGQVQLHIPSSQLDIVREGKLVPVDQVYLATDIVLGRFGVAAFGLVIPHPEGRPQYYLAEEGPAGTYGSIDQRGKYDFTDASPLTLSHYYDTDKGFALLRTIAAPNTVWEKLSQDKFLGPAVIDKSCLEDTINPEEFDEEYGLGVYDSIGREINDNYLEPLEDRLMERLGDSQGNSHIIIRQYPSWHSYRAYAQTLGAVSEAGRSTVANFDRALSLLTDLSPIPLFVELEQLAPGDAVTLPPG